MTTLPLYSPRLQVYLLHNKLSAGIAARTALGIGNTEMRAGSKAVKGTTSHRFTHAKLDGCAKGDASAQAAQELPQLLDWKRTDGWAALSLQQRTVEGLELARISA